jgi:cytochrome c oxidase subunit III
MSAAATGIDRNAATEARSAKKDRRETAAFGMWVFLASEAMFFGGLLFAYAYGRLRFPSGFAAAGRATDVLIGTVNTAVLLTSSFLVALAVTAATQRRRRYVAPLLAATALLGLLFLGLKAIEYQDDWTQGFFPGPAFHLGAGVGTVPAGAELFCMLYFTMTGVHALHMAIGVGWMGLAAWGARRRPAQWCVAPRLEVAGLYWHFVDVVWIVLYPLLYLVSRHA